VSRRPYPMLRNQPIHFLETRRFGSELLGDLPAGFGGLKQRQQRFSLQV